MSSKKVNELKPILEIENNEEEIGTVKVNRNFQRLKTFNDNLSDFTVNKLKQQLLDNACLNENLKLKKKKKKKKIDELELGKKLDDILSKSNNKNKNKNKNSNNNDKNSLKEKSINNKIITIESDNKKDKGKNRNRDDSNDNCKHYI